jgi:hypothetical protein
MGLLHGHDKDAVLTIDEQLRAAVEGRRHGSSNDDAEHAALLQHIDELLDRRRQAYEERVIRECELVIAAS